MGIRIAGISKKTSDASYLSVSAQVVDAPGLGLFFPEAHGGSIDAATAAARDAGGGTVYLGPVNYSTPPFSTYSNVRIEGRGGRSTTITMLSPVAQTWITATGTFGSSTALTGNVAAQATSVPVTSAAGLSVGQWVLIGDNAVPDASFATRKAGEMVRIAGIAGTTITLESPLANAFTTANSAFLQPLTNPITNLGLKGFTLVNPVPGTTTASGVTLIGCVGLDIDDLGMIGLDNPGLTVQQSADVRISRPYMRDFASDDANARFGYGINLNGPVTAALITGGLFENVRHGVTTGGIDGGFGHPTDVKVASSDAKGCKLAGFDTHGGVVGITFEACTVRGGNVSAAVGWQVRGKRVSIIGCHGYDLPSSAVFSTGVAQHLRVVGCVFERIVGDGISLDGDITGLDISGNVITDCTNRGVNLQSTSTSTSSVVIAHNDIRNYGTAFGGVEVQAGTAVRVENNTFRSGGVGVAIAAGAVSTQVYYNRGSDMNQAGLVTDAGSSSKIHSNFNIDFPTDSQTLASNGAVTFDLAKGRASLASGSLHKITLQANATSSSITGLGADGDELIIEWVQDATGSRTYAWPTIVRFAGGAAPTATTTALRRDIVKFRWDSTAGLFQELHRSLGVG